MASSTPGPPVKVGKCPICKTTGDPHYRPFCSRRCSNIDLARWLGGSYAIAGSSNDADMEGDNAETSQKLLKPQMKVEPDEDE